MATTRNHCDDLGDKKLRLNTVAKIVAIALLVGAGWADLRWQIRHLKEEVFLRMNDRWTKTDDHVFMKDFSNENNLTMPEHVKVSRTDVTGDG